MTNELEYVAVARDLMRNPEIRLLARTLASLAGMDKNNPPASFIMLANNIVKKPQQRAMLLNTIETCVGE